VQDEQQSILGDRLPLGDISSDLGNSLLPESGNSLEQEDMDASAANALELPSFGGWPSIAAEGDMDFDSEGELVTDMQGLGQYKAVFHLTTLCQLLESESESDDLRIQEDIMGNCNSGLGDDMRTCETDGPSIYNVPLQHETWADMTAMSVRLQALVEESGIAKDTHQDIINMMNSIIDKFDPRKLPAFLSAMPISF
jgi:hypothetical protein